MKMKYNSMRIIRIAVDSFLLANTIICIRDGLVTKPKNMDLYIPIFIAYMILTIFSNLIDKAMSYEIEKEYSKNNKTQFAEKDTKEMTENDIENEQSEKLKEIVSIHEAGHALMAILREVPFYYVYANVQGDTYTGNLQLKKVPQAIMTSDDFFNLAYITYGSIAAEEVLLGNVHGGCIGSENADFEFAEKNIMESILISSVAKSKILSYPELIKDAHTVSDIVYKQVLIKVKEYKEELQLIAEMIREKQTVYEHEIMQIVKESGYRKYDEMMQKIKE